MVSDTGRFQNSEFNEHASLEQNICCTLVEHMLNGAAYCKMLYCDGQAHDFIYLYTNPAFESLTGLKQVAGKRVSEVIPDLKEKDPKLFEIYSRFAAGGEPEQFELLVNSLDAWFSVSVFSPKPEHFVTIFDVITQYKQTELALKVANERWSLALSAAFVGTWDWDLTNNQTSFNTEYYKLLGLPDGIPHSYDDFLAMLHPDDRPHLEAKVMQVLNKEIPSYQIEFRLIRANDGMLRWLVSKGQVIFEHDQPLRGLGVIYDITERKKAELELEDSEFRWKFAIEASGDGLWDWNISDNTLFFTRRWQELLGCDKDDIGTGIEEWQKRIHPEDLANTLATLQDYLDGKTPTYVCEHRIVCQEGSHKWILDRGMMVSRAKDGKPLRMICMYTDITARKKAEMDLRISAIAFETQEGIIVTDANSKILQVNRAFTAITGYSAEEVIGQTPRLLKSDRQNADFYAQMWDSINQTGAWEGEIWNKHKNGTVYPENLMITSVKDTDNKVSNYVATLTDISLKKAADEKIMQMAFYDPLTGLANRRLMTDRLSKQLAHARRTGDLVTICMLDLDGFKQVNDQLGHEAGDALLIEVAKRLQECVRLSDTVSRFGGDEFSLILCDIKHIGECEQSFKRIIASLGAPYQINGRIARVTASIGATIFPNDGDTPDLLLRHADQAMYEAKESGKNCYCLFNPSHHKQQMSNQAMLDKIGKALVDDQLTLFYQPQVDCRLGQVVGVEALIRWNHPILGLLAPSEFIPLLEHDNLIISVGEWVIHEALRQQVEWKKAGFDLKISVNLASRHLHQEKFVEQLKATLADQDLDAVKRLTIEIVETTALEDISRVSETIRQCRDLGVQFAIDDFGTGFSSLAHLKHLPINELKIDKGFVFSMLQNQEDLAIVSGVIGLATSFKHDVVAEGVESIDQVLMLMNLGCNIMQGYLIARPMPAEQLTAWLKAFEPNPLWKLPFIQAPSRDYFELLLAETNHRHWINAQLESQEDEDFNPQQLLDHRQCRFGHWLYEDGNRQFGKDSWFLAILSLHKNIHDSALKLFEYERDGNQMKAATEAIYLQEQQNLLNDSLKNARKVLSDQYLMTRLN
jgi:diguanylate cyclase (GGDEF)-like protein/PAS domain S-box-containing protein